MKTKLTALLPLLAMALAACASEQDDISNADSAVASGRGVYVALGDSYAAGVGAGDYSDDCKRSKRSYAHQVAAALGYELDFVACIGAKIPDIRKHQLAALSTATKLVTITAGGNDTGFEDGLKQCAKPWPWTCSGLIEPAQAFINDELSGRLNDLYSEIRARAPNARVLVVGYPRPFNGETCNALARISSEEQEAWNHVNGLFSDTVEQVAVAHGFTYVDVRDAFKGHAACDDVEWINGLSWPVFESYHPNKAGYEEYTKLITSRLRSE